MILGYSRMHYVKFTLSTDVYTFIQCHNYAFEYFGGYTQEILYDNLKQIIIKRELKPKDHTWNAKFEDFFSYYGFIPLSANRIVLRPKERSKIPWIYQT
jgi:transposase